MVLKRLDDAQRDGDRIYAVIRDVGRRRDDAGVQPIESADADVGHTGAASGLVSFVKASLCLHHEVIPRHGAPRYWVRNRADGPRRASVSSHGRGRRQPACRARRHRGRARARAVRPLPDMKI